MGRYENNEELDTLKQEEVLGYYTAVKESIGEDPVVMGEFDQQIVEVICSKNDIDQEIKFLNKLKEPKFLELYLTNIRDQLITLREETEYKDKEETLTHHFVKVLAIKIEQEFTEGISLEEAKSRFRAYLRTPEIHTLLSTLQIGSEIGTTELKIAFNQEIKEIKIELNIANENKFFEFLVERFNENI